MLFIHSLFRWKTKMGVDPVSNPSGSAFIGNDDLDGFLKKTI